MGKEWIEHLANEIKQNGHEAAEQYGRDQHRAGIVTAEGKVFFMTLIICLEQDLSEIRSQLQGSTVSSETMIERNGPALARLSRSRFPWFDATLKHAEQDVALDYAQGRGVAGEQNLLLSADRQTAHFAFQVDARDRLSIAESFGDNPRQFDLPEALAKHILELLFAV